MIKFFRKIRQDLLSKGKTGKYFKYAVGEIILVVIGILIALGINNLNQNRINNEKQIEYLIGIKVDLEKQLKSFNESNQFYIQIIDMAESILINFSSSGKMSQIDSLNSKISVLMYTNKYPEISTTFKELNSTGQLTLIKEKTLRSQIIKYYQNSLFYQKYVDGNTENVIYNQIFPVMKSSIIISPKNFGFENQKINLEDNFKSSLNNILSNPNKEFELANVISLRIVVANSNKNLVERAKNEAELLLKEIKNELNDN